MGCTNAKNIVKIKRSLEIISCNNPRIDELFEPARKSIATLKSVLKDLKYSESDLKHITYTHIIKDCSLTDCILSFLLCLESSSENAIQYFELKFIPISPYLSLNKEKLTLEQNSILEAWASFLKTLAESGKKLQLLDEEFKNIIKELPNTESTCKSICNQVEMDTYEAANILRTALLNLNIINTIPKKITKSLESIQSMNESCYRLYREYEQEKLDQISRIGNKIKENGVQGIRNIVKGFWPEKEKIDLGLESIKRIKIDFKTQRREHI